MVERKHENTAFVTYEDSEGQLLSAYTCISPASIIYKSIAGRYRPVRVADGPITARYRFINNASGEGLGLSSLQEGKLDNAIFSSERVSH